MPNKLIQTRCATCGDPVKPENDYLCPVCNRCDHCGNIFAAAFFQVLPPICEGCIEERIKEMFPTPAGRLFIKYISRTNYSYLKLAVAQNFYREEQENG